MGARSRESQNPHPRLTSVVSHAILPHVPSSQPNNRNSLAHPPIQTVGLPSATVTRDDKGNVVINVKQDAALPLTPQSLTPGIRSDLNITIPPNASSVTTAGTVSGSPAFELNVSTEGGSDVNIPLQGAAGNPLAFATNLLQTNSILNFTPLPPPPPPCNNNQQTSCPK